MNVECGWKDGEFDGEYLCVEGGRVWGYIAFGCRAFRNGWHRGIRSEQRKDNNFCWMAAIMKINKFVIQRMVFDLSSKLIHSWPSLLRCGVSCGGGTRKVFCLVWFSSYNSPPCNLPPFTSPSSCISSQDATGEWLKLVGIEFNLFAGFPVMWF